MDAAPCSRHAARTARAQPLGFSRRTSLRHPDLTPLMQALLLGSILVLTAIVLLRFGLFFRQQYARLRYRYPRCD